MDTQEPFDKNVWRREAYKANRYGDKDIIQCYCGSTTKRTVYATHLKTKKHIEWMKGDRVWAEKKDPSYFYIHEARP
jgi:hypothetical protein